MDVQIISGHLSFAVITLYEVTVLSITSRLRDKMDSRKGKCKMKKYLLPAALTAFIIAGCQPDESTTAPKPSLEYNQSPSDIVDMHGEITNLDTFFTFLENVSDGKKDKIRVVRYTEEGDPMLHDLEYDGKSIISTTDTRRDTYGSGEITTVSCESVATEETAERTDYTLTGCGEPNGDNNILVIWK